MSAKHLVFSLGKLAFLVLAVGFWLTPAPASASPIAPGFDLFTSNDVLGNSLGASVDLGSLGLGVVGLEGLPFPFPPIPLPFPVDTIVERLGGIGPFDPPGGFQTVDIEIVALSLISTDPIDLAPLGGPFIWVFADLFTVINKDGIIPGLPQFDLLPPSIGKMEIRHEFGPLPSDDFGGTFDSIFGSPGDLNVPLGLQGLLTPSGGVTADAIFTVVGGDPASPADVLFTAVAPRLTIWSQGSTWEHTLPTDFQVTNIDHNCSFPECHPVNPVIIPEPTCLALLALGGLMLASRRRQMNRKADSEENTRYHANRKLHNF